MVISNEPPRCYDFFIATRILRCLFNFYHFHFFERFLAESFVVSRIITTFVAELEQTEKNDCDEDSVKRAY